MHVCDVAPFLASPSCFEGRCEMENVDETVNRGYHTKIIISKSEVTESEIPLLLLQLLFCTR